MLQRRAVEVGEEATQRIRTCTEVDTLQRWLDSAVVVDSVDELFA